MLKKYIKIVAVGFILGMIHLMPNTKHHPLITEKAVAQKETNTTDCKEQEDSQKEGDCMFEFPKLTGKYGVGTTNRHIIDPLRKEPQNPGSQRELMMYIWYPAIVPEKKHLIHYRADELEAVKNALKQTGFPEKDISELDTVYSHAIPEAPIFIQDAPYPLILFSHGFLGCSPIDYTAFCEELASHGYIVASIAHTYYAQIVKFPDGRQIVPPTEPMSPSPENQDLWAKDIQCTVDYLIKANANTKDQFNNLININCIGMIGHSMGGSTAFRLCLNDARFKTGISLDAAPWKQDGSVDDLKKPFMFIFAEQTIEDLKKTDEELAKLHGISVELVKKFRDLSQQKVRADMVIPHIKHSGFSDYLLIKEMPMYKNNRHITNFEMITGSADGRKTINLISQTMVNFFDNNLCVNIAKSISK